jgi:Holliday junction resolvasome RuvABC endonuclease subunit
MAKLLGLDLSTNTGWCLIEDTSPKPILLDYGLVQVDVETMLLYPWKYVDAAERLAEQLRLLIQKHNPDAIYIEETNGGGRASRFSQKLLEYIHIEVLKRIREHHLAAGVKINCIPAFTISSSSWRSAIKLRLTKEDKKNNSLISKAKSAKVSKKSLGVKGKITKKHLAVRYVNEFFGKEFKVKDNDICDAVCLILGVINGAKPEDGSY